MFQIIRNFVATFPKVDYKFLVFQIIRRFCSTFPKVDYKFLVKYLAPPFKRWIGKKIEILFLQTWKDILNTLKQLSKFSKSNFQTKMNSEIIDRMQEASIIKSVKVFKEKKGKNANGYKARRTAAYWEEEISRQRRKQGKTRYDTHRREEQPDAEDLRLEDIHFANFLGSKCEDGEPYNNVHIDEPVNLNECDTYDRGETSKNVPEKEQPEEEGEYINLEEYQARRQIEREENVVLHLDLGYIPETKTITSNGWYFKRGRDDESEEEHTNKRMRSESYEQEEINFAEMVAYMDEKKKEEAGMVAYMSEQEEAAMLNYMREQVKLAQQIAADELYPCDCDHF